MFLLVVEYRWLQLSSKFFMQLNRYKLWINSMNRQAVEEEHFRVILFTDGSTGRFIDRSRGHWCIKIFVFFFFIIRCSNTSPANACQLEATTVYTIEETHYCTNLRSALAVSHTSQQVIYRPLSILLLLSMNNWIEKDL